MTPQMPDKKQPYLPRYLDHELDELEGTPAIAINGAKGVGKTSTAVRRADIMYSLDRSTDFELMSAAMDTKLREDPVICLDEWQRLPELWDAVRHNVDEGVSNRYLFTGSASPIPGTDTHSGAGRILALTMRPLCLAEYEETTPTVLIDDLFAGNATIKGTSDWTIEDYAEALCATGLPGVKDLPARQRRATISRYIDYAVTHDVVDQGMRVQRPDMLRAWWAAYAAATATTTSYTKILNAATPGEADKVAKGTSLNYRTILTQLQLIEPVPAWSPNYSPFTRLTGAPKHHVFDPGIAAALLRLTPDMLLSQAPGGFEAFGQLFESLVTLTVRVAGQAAEASTFHLRTQGGKQEVDLILERYDGKVIAFEVKTKPTPTDRDVRHLHWLKEKLGDRLVDAVVVTTGPAAYRRKDDIAVVPLALLG